MNQNYSLQSRGANTMIIRIDNMCKKFDDNIVLDQFHMSVEENEFVVVIGKSGSGKSTLLNIIGLLEKMTSGSMEIFGKKDVKPFSTKASRILKNKIGYIFQNYALLEDKTVLYNLMICIENVKIKNKKAKIAEALKEVGLNGYESKKVYQCSGGERQRIAIARLLLKPCELILADEPTGSLDKINKEVIYSMLKLLQKKGKTIVVVTHDDDLIKLADRCITLDNN